MKNKYIVPAVVVLVVLVIGVLYFNNSGSKNSNPSSIKLGLMLPLTGDYSAAGQNIQKGMELALDDYRKAHPGSSITTVIEDDAYNAKMGVTAYKKLTDIDKVDSILMLSTPVIDAIYKDVVKSGIPVIQLGVQTVGVADDNIFQFSPAAEAPIGFLARYLGDNSGFYSKKVAVVYDNSSAQLSFFKAFQDNYKKDFTPFIVNSKNDLQDYASKIANGKYGAVVVIESPQNGALLAKDILTVDSTMPLLAFDAQLQTGFADFGRILGDTNKINGAISMWFKAGKVDQFKQEFKTKYGEDPGFLTDFGYDMINAALNTYDKNDATWVSNLKKFSDPNGVSGSISFDRDGVRIQPMTITVIKNGQLVPTDQVNL
ncbi:MAG: ABC transporter substrate-binding protein [Candidatus Taylorbacteria bacterium]